MSDERAALILAVAVLEMVQAFKMRVDIGALETALATVRTDMARLEWMADILRGRR